MNRTLFISALAFAALTSSEAQAKSDFQQWTTLSATFKLTDRFRLSNELVVRFSDNRNGLYEVENSLLLGYKINDHVTAWAGYVHDPNYAAGDFTVMERRAREQVTFDNIAKIGKASVSARIRLEQRWRDHVDGTAWRMRPYAKVGIPLGGKKAPTLTLSEELFVNLNNTSYQTTDGLERARTAAALSLPVTTQIKLEAGYLNQHRFVRGAPDLDDNVLTGGIGFSF